MNWKELADTAKKAALAAGSILQERAQEKIDFKLKEGGSSYASQVVTEVDKACERAILDELQPSIEKYGLGLLTEEETDDGSRFQKDYFWCIDPLDGTLAFIEQRADYAVSVALIERSGRPVIGTIYDPNRNVLYQAISGQGAFRNGAPWTISAESDTLSYISDHSLEKSVGPEVIQAMIADKQAALGLSKTQIISGGGLVINAMRTAEQAPAFMVKLPKERPGCGSIWDYAASACICQELGMEVRKFTGGPLELNKKGSTFMNDGGMYYATWH